MPLMPRNPFHAYIRAAGAMTRENPELKRLAKLTGYTVEHLFRVCLGDRKPSMPCARAIARAVKDKAVTETSLLAGNL